MTHCSSKILPVMLVPADNSAFKYKMKKKTEINVLLDSFMSCDWIF